MSGPQIQARVFNASPLLSVRFAEATTWLKMKLDSAQLTFHDDAITKTTFEIDQQAGRVVSQPDNSCSFLEPTILDKLVVETNNAN